LKLNATPLLSSRKPKSATEPILLVVRQHFAEVRFGHTSYFGVVEALPLWRLRATAA
jgi:hypothetical protein